jgi:septum formation topological specificity factor MinE
MRGGSFGGGGFSIRGYGSPEPEDPEMRDLMRKDSEMERQTMELAAQIRRAKPEEREKLKKDISELVAKHFEVRQERRKLQLKRMEEELKRLREAITKRDDSSDSIVKNRIAELIGEPRELDF